MPRKQKQNEFGKASTRYCDVCKIDVKLSFGGESNWLTHLESKAHLAHANTQSQHKGIGFFFAKAAEKANLTATASLRPPALTSNFPSHPHPPILLESSSTSHNTSSPANTVSECAAAAPLLSLSSSSMLAKLSRVIKTLPEDVPMAQEDDVLARFSGDPSAEIEEDEDSWEMVDKALNRVFGFGASVEEISRLVRRGNLGMDGLCQWLSACLTKLRISEDLLEGKVGRLIDAMHLLGAHDDTTLQNTSQVVKLSAAPNLQATEETIRLQCPGYRLRFADNQPAASSYPFLLHGVQTLPWTLSTSTNTNALYLRSTACTKFTENATACPSCRQLHDHTVIMGIRHRSLAGTHENTPWAYLSASQMYSALQKKTEDINQLKLRSLNLMRTIGVRNRHLDAWKRFSMAVGKEDIPRIRSLLATEIRAGSSVFSLLEKVEQAARRKYNPRGYQESDYQLGFLIYKIGGRSAANIAHRALGIPSIDTSKRHISTSPLIPSPSFPTSYELQSNLATCYPDNPDMLSNVISGITMHVDEIKLQERLRWEQTSNKILGVCREHGTQCALEFRSIHQADALVDCLRSKTVHLATEATVIGASEISANPNKYTTKVFAISGSCKRETVEDQERLLRESSDALINHARTHNQRLYAIASDGDSRRRRALIAISDVPAPA